MAFHRTFHPQSDLDGIREKLVSPPQPTRGEGEQGKGFNTEHTENTEDTEKEEKDLTTETQRAQRNTAHGCD
jgi:hypothetical protein